MRKRRATCPTWISVTVQSATSVAVALGTKGSALFLLVYAVSVAAFGVQAETRELAAQARNRLRRRGSTW